MRHGIPSFRPRQPLDRQLTSDTLNRILSELESLRIVSVVNGTFRKLPGGTEINVAPQRGGAGAPTETHPFKIASSGESVTVQPGTINSVLPSNTFDGGALRQFGVSPDTLSYVVLTASSDGSQITTAALSVETTAPPAQTPAAFGVPASAEWLLAVVYNSSVHQIIDDNLVVTGTQQFIADRDGTPEVGQLPYVAYFVWA